MDNNGFMPNNNPVAPQPQSQPQPQNVNPQPLPEQPQIMASTPAEPIVTEQFTTPIAPNNPIASSTPSEKKHLPLIPIIASACTLGIIAIVVVVVLLMNRSGVSISSVRNFCNKNNLVVEEETNESPKAEYISCASASKSGKIDSIVYTVLYEGSFDDYSEFSSIKSIVSSMMTTLEDTDSYKKYYFDGSSYGSVSSYLIMEDKAYITATGNESAIRAALIEIGYPDRNWATEESSEQSGSSSLQVSQRDNARQNDLAFFISNVKMYQTSNRGALPGVAEVDKDVVNIDGGTAVEGNQAQNTWAGFYRDYLGKGYLDPSGEYYNLLITKCGSNENVDCIGAGTSGMSFISELATTSFPNGYTIGVILQAKCNGTTTVGSSNPRNLAVIYRLEGSGIFCSNT